jgi:hypothetical protein
VGAGRPSVETVSTGELAQENWAAIYISSDKQAGMVSKRGTAEPNRRTGPRRLAGDRSQKHINGCE